MQGVQGAHGYWKRFDCSCQHRRFKFNEDKPPNQGSSRITVRSRKSARVDAVPDLVYKQPTGNQNLTPDRLRRRAILGQEMRQGDRRIQIDHRSSRSCCNSRISSPNGMTGFRGGGAVSTSVGGVSHPSRTAWARSASERTGLRAAWGGTSSATTRSRSVTRTVSPLAASRTYSLSLFLRTFRPTERIYTKVATGSYIVNPS